MEYEEFKNRLKDLGFTLKDFVEYVGANATNPTYWKNNGLPDWVVKVVHLLESEKKLKSHLEACEDRIKRMCEEGRK